MNSFGRAQGWLGFPTPSPRPRVSLQVAGWLLAVALALFFPGIGGARAQDNPNQTADLIKSMIASGMSEDQIREALKQNEQSSQSSPVPVAPRNTISPAVSAPAASRSNLENLYSSRIGTKISQFGYDLISNGGTAPNTLAGAVQDDYLLGPNDQIVITLRGQENATYSAYVNRDGLVILPKLPPISASGRHFGDFRKDLEAAVRRAYLQTQLFVSLGAVRQVSVRVVGEVENPGVYPLTGLSSVLDALALAGGIRKSGSLRSVSVVRAGQSFNIDLYTMLLSHGRTPDMTVADGDRIVVGPIGATVAVSGDVRRPAIYELRKGAREATAGELLNLANGPEIRGVYRQIVRRILPDGKEQFVDVTNAPSTPVRDGEVLSVFRAVKKSIGSVRLEGAVNLPGLFSLDHTKTLHDLLRSNDDLAPGAYMLFGAIQRIDRQTLQQTIVPFSLLRVLAGTENVDLLSDDVVHVFTVPEMRNYARKHYLADTESGNDTQDAQANPQSAQDASIANGVSEPTTNTASDSPDVSSQTALPGQDTASEADTSIALDPTDYVVRLVGAVRDPGLYLVAPGTTLDQLISAARGLTSDADVSGFEVTATRLDNEKGTSDTRRKFVTIKPSEYDTVLLQPRDTINFHRTFTNRMSGTVTVSGQVRYPGQYELLRGERLSEVMVRAGGLTDIAYPYGTVFTRRSLVELERQGYHRVAKDMQEAIFEMLGRSASSASGGKSDAAGSIAALMGLVSEVRDTKPVGRMPVIADPSVLAARPQDDPILQPGDAIFVPQRPSTVTVMGAVMEPGSYRHASGLTAADYIDQAGGYRTNADEDDVYVVYPDGRAEKFAKSWLSFDNDKLPPGSVIFVPRDVFPTAWTDLVTTFSSIIKDLAVSAASVAVLSK